MFFIIERSVLINAANVLSFRASYFEIRILNLPLVCLKCLRYFHDRHYGLTSQIVFSSLAKAKRVSSFRFQAMSTAE
jgi:hypothetical protein